MGRTALLATIAMLATAGAAAQQPEPNPADDSAAVEARAQIDACATYKFETSAKVAVNGKGRRLSVKLCGVNAKNDADWVGTLEDAIEKVETNDRFPAEAKEQIVGALKAEIAKYAPAEPAQPIVAINPSAPPSLALPAKPANNVVGPPVEYSALPPLPAPVAARPVAKPASLPARPSLDISCFTPGDLGTGGPCMTIERGTVISVKAQQPLAGGYGLRFLRRGEPQGDVALAEMRKGKSVQLGIPLQLCAGVNGSRIELQVVHGNQVLETMGPYHLRC